MKLRKTPLPTALPALRHPEGMDPAPGAAPGAPRPGGLIPPRNPRLGARPRCFSTAEGNLCRLKNGLKGTPTGYSQGRLQRQRCQRWLGHGEALEEPPAPHRSRTMLPLQGPAWAKVTAPKTPRQRNGRGRCGTPRGLAGGSEQQRPERGDFGGSCGGPSRRSTPGACPAVPQLPHRSPA